MWRTFLITLLLTGIATLARAQATPWQACHGVLTPAGPVLSDCRTIQDPIDPQGRELWIRSTIERPTDTRPRALYVAGVASSQAWLNDQRLGANGLPAAAARDEVPGRYQAMFPIRETAWRPGENVLVLRLSSFHGGLRFAGPMSAIGIFPYPYPQRTALLAVTFVAAGALLAAAFGFGVIHVLRRTASSLVLAAMAGVAAVQAIVESLRTLFDYAYPLHAWRMSAIWGLAAAFAILLVSYVTGRFLPRARGLMIGLAVGGVGATALLPGFDIKTVWALILGVALAALPAAAGVRARRPGARLTLAYLALFLALALGFPEWLADLSFFLLAAGLVLPLLVVEVVRLGRDDQGREAALTRAASRPDRLTVASARGVELVPIVDILAVVGHAPRIDSVIFGLSQLRDLDLIVIDVDRRALAGQEGEGLAAAHQKPKDVRAPFIDDFERLSALGGTGNIEKPVASGDVEKFRPRQFKLYVERQIAREN